MGGVTAKTQYPEKGKTDLRCADTYHGRGRKEDQAVEEEEAQEENEEEKGEEEGEEEEEKGEEEKEDKTSSSPPLGEVRKVCSERAARYPVLCRPAAYADHAAGGTSHDRFVRRGGEIRVRFVPGGEIRVRFVPGGEIRVRFVPGGGGI